MVFLWFSHEITIFLWFSYGLPPFSDGFPMVFLSSSHHGPLAAPVARCPGNAGRTRDPRSSRPGHQSTPGSGEGGVHLKVEVGVLNIYHIKMYIYLYI